MIADVVELADTQDLESCLARGGSSTLPIRINNFVIMKFKNNLFSLGFTLIELLIVIIIIGIIATFGMTSYFKAVVATQDKDAQAMLSMMQQAEKVAFLEKYEYVPCTNTANCRDELNIPSFSSQTWDCSVPAANITATTYCAQAILKNGGARQWHIDYDYNASGGPDAPVNVSSGPCS